MRNVNDEDEAYSWYKCSFSGWLIALHNTAIASSLFQLLHQSKLKIGKNHDDHSDDPERQYVRPQAPVTVMFDTLICQIF